MLVLAMAPALGHEPPAVSLDQPDDLTEFQTPILRRNRLSFVTRLELFVHRTVLRYNGLRQFDVSDLAAGQSGSPPSARSSPARPAGPISPTHSSCGRVP